MDTNFTLTDKDIADGYILACQAHPTSEELTLTFDE
jgi:ring-1,2-phenylacetyl-CoA epoxidase subunit PaaE